MTTPTHSGATDERVLHAATSMDAVTLHVGDLDAMAAYYAQALALEPLEERARGRHVHRVLGRGTTPMLRLVHTPDLPGVDPDSIDCTVERNVLTVRAERRRPSGENVELVAAERPMGTFTRQLFLGDTLDTDRLEAGYENGVLTLRIPIAERAKPRRITVATPAEGNGRRQLTTA